MPSLHNLVSLSRAASKELHCFFSAIIMSASFIHIKKCLDVVQQFLLQLGYTLPSDIVLILRLKMELNCRRLKKVTKAWFGTDVSIYWGFEYINICQWIWHRSAPSTLDQAIK